MADVPVTLILPAGGTRSAEVPDDVPVRELLPELTTTLELPVVGPDGRPMSYRIDSKALGRELKEEETLSQAGVPSQDRLMLTTDVTAGSRTPALHRTPAPPHLRFGAGVAGGARGCGEIPGTM
jgi:hypothetical protein